MRINVQPAAVQGCGAGTFRRIFVVALHWESRCKQQRRQVNECLVFFGILTVLLVLSRGSNCQAWFSVEQDGGSNFPAAFRTNVLIHFLTF